MSVKSYLAEPSQEEQLWEAYMKVEDRSKIVKGYPDDLISCILALRAEGEQPSLVDVVDEFYAPPPITLTFLKKAEEEGVLSVQPGKVCVKEKGYYVVQGLGLELKANRDSKYFLAMKEAIEKEKALVKEGKRLRVFLATPEFFPFKVTGSFSEAVEVRGILPNADPLYVRGISFGIHDYVVADIYPSWEDAICDLVCANLKPYGVAFLGYTPFVGGKGGYTLKDMLGTMEEKHGLFTTDIYRKGYAYVFRVVKYPELLELRKNDED